MADEKKWRMLRAKIDGDPVAGTAVGTCPGCHKDVRVGFPPSAKGLTAVACPECGVKLSIDVGQP